MVDYAGPAALGRVGEKLTAQARFEALNTEMDPYLQRGRVFARLTVPYVLPDTDITKSVKLPELATNIGARYVNNLTAKLALASVPPNTSFFRYEVDPVVSLQLTGDPKVEQQWNTNLKLLERRSQQRLREFRVRPAAMKMIRQLLVHGNPCFHYNRKEKQCRVISPTQFRVTRDCMGNIQEALIQEKIAYASMPENARAALARSRAKKHITDPVQDKEEFTLYTVIERESKYWFALWSEIEDEVVEGTRGGYTPERLPYLFPRILPDLHYSRAYVEDYACDLLVAHIYANTLLKGTMASARVVFGVDPNGLTSPDDLEKAENGQFIRGRQQDVTAFRVDKASDLSVGAAAFKELKQELGEAFLMFSAIRRDAERVTAEEIRRLAEEADTSLGGLYSALTDEFTLPLMRLVVDDIQRDRETRVMINEELVIPKIITGIEALGRSAGLDRLNGALAIGRQALPTMHEMTLNPIAVQQQIWLESGCDPSSAVKSSEEFTQMMKAQQEQAAAAAVGPEIIKQFGNAATPRAA